MNYIIHKKKNYSGNIINCIECAQTYRAYIQRIKRTEYIGCKVCPNNTIANKLNIFIKFTNNGNIYRYDRLVSCVKMYDIDYSIYKLIL